MTILHSGLENEFSDASFGIVQGSKFKVQRPSIRFTRLRLMTILHSGIENEFSDASFGIVQGSKPQGGWEKFKVQGSKA